MACVSEAEVNVDVGGAQPQDKDVEKASVPQSGTEEQAGSWGKYVVGAIVALALVCCVLMLGSTNYDAIAVLFAFVAILLEFALGYPLHRLRGWAGYQGRASTRFSEDTFALGFCRIAKMGDQAEEEVTVDGVKRKSGYTGQLFDCFPMPRHVIGALSGDAGIDFRYGAFRILLGTVCAMITTGVLVALLSLPASGITLDWSACSDAECRMSTFERQIFDSADCQTRSGAWDRSAMEQLMPFDLLKGFNKIQMWSFLNIGTTVNTIIFINYVSPSAMMMMWAVSLGCTGVMTLTTLLPFNGSGLGPGVVLVFALMHSVHTLMLELFSTPRRFSRFSCPKTIAFFIGFFIHFLVGIILVFILVSVDTVIDKLQLPSTSATMVMSLLISAGESILQFVFSKLYEVPMAAATMQLSGFQYAAYARVRLYFVTLPTSELVWCSATNMLMDIGLRGFMLPFKGFMFNQELKADGPGKGLSQQMGVYLANMMSSMTADHVAILMINVLSAMANPLANQVGQGASGALSSSDILTRYFIQFGIAAAGNAFVVLMVLGYLQLNLKPYVEQCHDRLFYFGMFLTILTAVSLEFSNSFNSPCWFCDSRDECMGYIAIGAGFVNSTAT